MRKKLSIILCATVAVTLSACGWYAPKTDPAGADFLKTVQGEIVYAHRDDNVLNIYTISANGSNKKMLFHNEDANNPNAMFPRWSEDRTQIYFTAMKDGAFKTFVMDADGTNVRISERSNDITSTPSREADILSENGSLSYVENGVKIPVYSFSGYDASLSPGASEASWSPERKYIVFQSCNLGGCSIMIADREGRSAKLTDGMQPDW